MSIVDKVNKNCPNHLKFAVQVVPTMIDDYIDDYLDYYDDYHDEP